MFTYNHVRDDRVGRGTLQHPASLCCSPRRQHLGAIISSRAPSGAHRPARHGPAAAAPSGASGRSAATVRSSKPASTTVTVPAPAAAQQPGPAGRASSTGSSGGRAGGTSSLPVLEGQDLNAALVAALAEQFRRESLPWIRDLVEPILQGPPQPLKGTVSPELLADPDSRFVTVNGIRVHYKMSLPGEKESGMPSAAGTAASGGTPRSRTLQTVAGLADAPNPNAAPTLLLMHGLNGSTFNWRLLIDDLAAYVSPSTGGCRVIAYDRPPYGLSERPRGPWRSEEDNPYTLQGGARLAHALLTSLAVEPAGSVPSSPPSSSSSSSSSSTVAGAASGSIPCASQPTAAARQAARPRAVLVGHSAGAAVAVEMALRYPDEVGGLVLIAPAISTDQRGFLARADLGQLLRFAWTRALLSADGTGLNYVRRQVSKRRAEVEEGRLGIYLDEREVPQEIIDGYLRPLRAKDWDWGTLLAYRAFQVSGAPQPLEQLRVPVLVVQGRQDRAVPLEVAQSAVDVLRRRRGTDAVTEFQILEGCGHVPMDEKPLEVRQAVVDFVNRHCCKAADLPDTLSRARAGTGAGTGTRSAPEPASEGSGWASAEVPAGTVMARLFGQGRGNPR